MDYKFFILTTDGVVSANITSECDFSCAPFGYVPYRVVSSCECDPPVIEDFWRCIDEVLSENQLTSMNFIRAIRAESENNIYGEIITHSDKHTINEVKI
jgi:hypothetical protein